MRNALPIGETKHGNAEKLLLVNDKADDVRSTLERTNAELGNEKV
jgi:hypothetical protein